MHSKKSKWFSKAINHKYIVKIRSFSSAKVQCMYDNGKLATRSVNRGNIVLLAETSDFNSEKTSSQIATLWNWQSCFRPRPITSRYP